VSVTGPDPDLCEPPPRVVVARAHDERGELALARRGDVLELVVDGVFAMDSAHTTTERALATLALERVTGDGLRVVVGGLGLGVTARTVLDETRVAHLDVVELHAALVAWARDGLLPALPEAVGGEVDRLLLVVGDVLDVVPALAPGSRDAILLDVDNGPGFLVHEGNAAVYGTAFLAAAARALAPGGVLAVWSADPAPALADALTRACGPCETVTLDAARDGHEFTYTLYLARRAAP
jgi:spermidine synthase